MHTMPLRNGGFRENWRSENRTSLVLKTANEPLQAKYVWRMRSLHVAHPNKIWEELIGWARRAHENYKCVQNITLKIRKEDKFLCQLDERVK